MNRKEKDGCVFQKSYAWEDKPISDLSPGDILVSQWEYGKPIGIVNGPATTGQHVIPGQPKSADFVFVPVRPIEASWNAGHLVYKETGQEGIYQVFDPHNETTPVAVVG